MAIIVRGVFVKQYVNVLLNIFTVLLGRGIEMNNEPIAFLDTENKGLSLQRGNLESLILIVLNVFLGILQGQLFKQPLKGAGKSPTKKLTLFAKQTLMLI